MTIEGTQPAQMRSLPVRRIRVAVLEGVDAGKTCAAEAEALSVGTADGNDLVLTDPTVSRFHAEFSRSADGVRVVDHGSTNGIFVGDVCVERAIVIPGTVLRFGKTNLRVVDDEAATLELHASENLGGLRGRSPVMRRLMARVERAARTSVAILAVGESGTGKEVVARALHELGPRAQGPFVTVDCGSLSPTLVASELFGHERGAFTGADRQHIGAFERANGGTLFLDEIGELPASLQPTLLGALERHRFRRLGGRTEIAVDLRVVSATNRDLRAEVNAGTFRLDLYYRLAIVVLQVPPLRDRADDVPLLVEHFLRECGHAGTVGELISPAAMESLRTHRWPGNVRELRNLIEATVAMGESPVLEAHPIPDAKGAQTDGAIRAEGPSDAIAPLLERPYGPARNALLAEFEVRYLRRLLERSEGNVSRAAREARMDRSHLIDMLHRHQLR